MNIFRTPHLRAAGCALALAIGLTACKRESQTPAATAHPTAATVSAVTLSKIELGTTLRTDGTVVAPSASFKQDDTVNVAITLNGSAPTVAIKTRWSRAEDESVISESSKVLKNTAGATVIDFQLPPSNDRKPGRYKVMASVDGSPSGLIEFTIGQ